MSLRHYDVFAVVCRIQICERRDRLSRLLSLRGEAGRDNEGCEPGRAGGNCFFRQPRGGFQPHHENLRQHRDHP